MAELKGNVLGKIRGKVGTLSGRVRNGKNYLASLPASFNTPMDSNSRARREKFKAAVLFSKAVNADPLLKAIWNDKNIDNATVFNLVMQKNYPLILNNMPSDSNIITPIDGFNPNYSSATYEDGVVSITTDPLTGELEIDPAIEIGIAVTGFLYGDDPSNDSLPAYQYFNFTSDEMAIDLENPLTFSIDLTYSQKSQLANYQIIKIYSALLTLDAEQFPVQYSATNVN